VKWLDKILSRLFLDYLQINIPPKSIDKAKIKKQSVKPLRRVDLGGGSRKLYWHATIATTDSDCSRWQNRSI
jgi:hypothetical protein